MSLLQKYVLFVGLDFVVVVHPAARVGGVVRQVAHDVEAASGDLGGEEVEVNKVVVGLGGGIVATAATH